MLSLVRITEVYELKVFTDSGEYFGDIEEAIISKNKVTGWRVKSTKNSYLNKALGSAKGVIVPHALVKAVSDIMIISRNAMPSNVEEQAAMPEMQ